jgi:hypothetical protein
VNTHTGGLLSIFGLRTLQSSVYFCYKYPLLSTSQNSTPRPCAAESYTGELPRYAGCLISFCLMTGTKDTRTRAAPQDWVGGVNGSELGHCFA